MLVFEYFQSERLILPFEGTVPKYFQTSFSQLLIGLSDERNKSYVNSFLNEESSASLKWWNVDEYPN
jgi:hypothetical protein